MLIGTNGYRIIYCWTQKTLLIWFHSVALTFITSLLLNEHQDVFLLLASLVDKQDYLQLYCWLSMSDAQTLEISTYGTN